jgi:hypothetical protein
MTHHIELSRRAAGTVMGLLLSAVLMRDASAYDAYDPANCNGADWSADLAVTVAKVTAAPRVNFVKSPYDDDFSAAACPAATEACRKRAYLVTGDLVLVGRRRGDFTCVSYQSPLARKKQIRADGWLPDAALTPVAPMPAPIGTWCNPDCRIEIGAGEGGRLLVDGEGVFPTAHDFHDGGFKAQVTPQDDAIAFADDGSNYGEECRVRMQRIGPWLLVVDNAGCGGTGVSFTGLYRRK